ncbi:MAG: hypothetical protein QW186_08980 [Candidatus Bathyarchaeia archaeon]
MSYLLGRRTLRFSTVVRNVGVLKRLAECVGSLVDVDAVVRFPNSVGRAKGYITIRHTSKK